MPQTVSLPTLSSLSMMEPSGANAGAGNVIQSTSSQKSFDQSADQTLTRLSALVASHSSGAVMPTSWSCGGYSIYVHMVMKPTKRCENQPFNMLGVLGFCWTEYVFSHCFMTYKCFLWQKEPNNFLYTTHLSGQCPAKKYFFLKTWGKVIVFPNFLWAYCLSTTDNLSFKVYWG